MRPAKLSNKSMRLLEQPLLDGMIVTYNAAAFFGSSFAISLRTAFPVSTISKAERPVNPYRSIAVTKAALMRFETRLCV